MKANEFIKKYGLNRIRHLLAMSSNAIVYCLDGEHVHVDDLKLLVESHELVESYGGLESAKSTVNYPNFLNDEDVKTTNHRLSKAILDVESCQ